MTLFKDFLREKAKFYSPPTTGHKPDDTSVNMDGVRAIHEGLLPKAAWKDADMIENLLKTVDDRLGDRVLPAPEATWERHFEPEVDDERTLLSWSVNKQKSDVRTSLDTRRTSLTDTPNRPWEWLNLVRLMR